MLRTKEEVRYIREEMRRTLETLQWQADQWKLKAKQRLKSNVTLNPELTEGLISYSKKQAGVQEGLKGNFIHLWQQPLVDEDSPEDLEEVGLQMILGFNVGPDEDEEGLVEENELGWEGNDAGDERGADIEDEMGEESELEDLGFV
jgi:hypothetical protein